jgi:hypothetical protein
MWGGGGRWQKYVSLKNTLNKRTVPSKLKYANFSERTQDSLTCSCLVNNERIDSKWKVT